ncbi:MAG: hypothetical protein RPT12_17005 [Vibrio anguillarum]|nr:hypothetical protein [Vibrio anguillarum]
MSDLSNLKFPSMRSVQQVKKDAKRLRKSQGITLTEALNQCAKKNGIALPWDQAIEELKRISKENEVTQSNTNPAFRLPVHLDEATPYMTGSSIKLRDEINATVARKNYVPVLTFDYSELPKNVFDALMAHNMVKRFKVDSQRSDIEVVQVKPSSNRAHQDWKIRVSFDVWGVSDIPMDILNDWVVFKEWLLQFNLTDRVRVADRLKNHSFLTYHTQAHPDYSLHKLYDDMSSKDDKHLLFVLLNPNTVFMQDEAAPIIKEFAQTLKPKYSSELVKILKGK